MRMERDQRRTKYPAHLGLKQTDIWLICKQAISFMTSLSTIIMEQAVELFGKHEHHTIYCMIIINNKWLTGAVKPK